MDILQDERERRFTFICLVSEVIHRAGRRIKKKRAIVGLAIVVTSGTKSGGAAKYQERRRPLPPMMLRVYQRRIKGREIRDAHRKTIVKIVFEGAKGRIKAEP